MPAIPPVVHTYFNNGNSDNVKTLKTGSLKMSQRILRICTGSRTRIGFPSVFFLFQAPAYTGYVRVRGVRTHTRRTGIPQPWLSLDQTNRFLRQTGVSVIRYEFLRQNGRFGNLEYDRS
jgi:hypothetical protein